MEVFFVPRFGAFMRQTTQDRTTGSQEGVSLWQPGGLYLMMTMATWVYAWAKISWYYTDMPPK